MQPIISQLNIFRTKIVHIMANVSWRAEPEAEMLLLVILWYIVLILLLISIHRKLLRTHRRTHENLIASYDMLRYQVAKAQYENPSIQDGAGIKTVIDAEHKSYLANSAAIKTEIQSIEQTLGQWIIAPEQRIKIQRQTKKKHRLFIFNQLIGRLITLLTVGIYKLFW